MRLRLLALVLVLLTLATSAGCARAKNSPVDAGPLPSMTETETPTTVSPSATPEAAVSAYLGIVQRAYYSLDSTLVAPFVTPSQWVREDAYIQLNLTQNQAIEMNLLAFEVTEESDVSVDTTSTFLSADEQWRWRYWDLKTRKPKSEWTEIEYVVRYTLDRLDGGWLVGQTEVLDESEEATATGAP